MNEKKLFITGFSVLTALLLLLYYFFSKDIITNHVFYAILLAAVLSCLNFAGAIYSIKISYKRDITSSLNTYLIGMGVRLPILMTALIISILFLDISDNSLIFSVLIFYIYFLIMEILFLNIARK